MLRKFDGLKIASKIARGRSGKCLSIEYINSKTKLLWECDKGHRWIASLNNVKNNFRWCPYCAKNVRLCIKDANIIASSNNGFCLSTEYKNAHTKLKWKCTIGHIWYASLNNVRNNKQWCCVCANKKRGERSRLDGIKIAQQIAKEHKGKCLSIKYKNIDTKMEWECKKEHRWKATLGGVKDCKSWCPYCAKVKVEDGLFDAHLIAKEKNGKCLTHEYTLNSTKMLWECEEKHQWKTSLNSIKSGTWCPYCANCVKMDIKIANEIAEEKNGKCLSVKYINNHTKMLWKCNKGHKWNASLSSIKRGHWCRYCGYLKTAKASNNSYILYHWKTNEELVCQASWEKKTVEYFNKNKINFRWQLKTFEMPNGKTYRPDCYLFSTKKWVEIKGYFRKDAKEKWDWFHKEHSNSELWDKNKLKEMGIL